MSEHPARLRPLDARPLERDGDPLVALRDPLGVACTPEPLVVPASFLEVARHFDGCTDADTLARIISSKGHELGRGTIAKVAQLFSAHLCLEDQAFEDARREALDNFRELPSRPAVGPGRDYESDPIDLRIRVAGLVADDWDLPTPQGLFAALAPASELSRASRLYSRTYAALRHAGEDIARVVVLAASPTPLTHALVPLCKDLETPLGTLKHDSEAVSALSVVPGVDELAHRDALCLERQTLFLRLLFPQVPVVACLVGSPEPASSPDQADPRTAFAHALSGLERVLELPGRTLLLVASDLSSARSRDPSRAALTPTERGALRERDRLATEAALALEPGEFWRACCLPAGHARSNPLPLWLVLELAARRTHGRGEQRLRGSVLGYQQLPRPGDLISAASIVFHREPAQTRERTED